MTASAAGGLESVCSQFPTYDEGKSWKKSWTVLDTELIVLDSPAAVPFFGHDPAAIDDATETGEWAPGCALARRFGRAGGGGEQATRCLPAETVSGAGRFGGPNLNGKNENKKQTPLRVYNTH